MAANSKGTASSNASSIEGSGVSETGRSSDNRVVRLLACAAVLNSPPLGTPIIRRNVHDY